MKEQAGPPRDRRALVAVDLGAESCRVSLLRWRNDAPEITLVHRFLNSPVQHGDCLCWPLQAIVEGVDLGLRKCADLAPESVRSVAVDGWAVDYVRLSEDGTPLSEPFCYRDHRTVAAQHELHRKISPERMRELTGVQDQPLNTVYQLYADRRSGMPEVHWLNLPEYLLARWGGDSVSEFTNAGHTQLVDLDSRNWSPEIFAAAGLDLRCAPPIVPPGTIVGKLEGPLSKLAAFRDTDLIAPACHDTASAIAGIPACGDDWAYISSGTWSLVGAVLKRPLNTAGTHEDNFTNLGAAGGGTCFHKGVNGMWLLTQCRNAWSDAGVIWSIEDLLAAADRLPPPESLLDLEDPDLLLMGQMPSRINAHRQRMGAALLDEAPGNAPAFTSLILYSLAARYGGILDRLQHHTGKRPTRIFIVGGGSRNALLQRLTHQFTGLEVLRGSAESSTIGNFAVQLATLEQKVAGVRGTLDEEISLWSALLLDVDTSR